MLNAIIAGVVGLISGAIGSLVAPWVAWGIEKRRIKHDRRVELIVRWREILSDQDFDRTHLLNDPSYGPLKELLSQKAKEKLERPTNHISLSLNSPITNFDRDIALQEVARIEKHWGLI